MRKKVEEQAERVLATVPDWIWNGDTLPVPVEHIADSCFGLHVRDVGDLSAAPGVPSLAAGQSLSGLLLPGVGEIWVNAAEARDWPARRRFTTTGSPEPLPDPEPPDPPPPKLEPPPPPPPPKPELPDPAWASASAASASCASTTATTTKDQPRIRLEC